jgi:hypothetical protein
VVRGMWTDEHRAVYRRDGDGFPSNLTDAEWERLDRNASPSAAMIDSQTLKSAGKGAVKTTRSATMPPRR